MEKEFRCKYWWPRESNTIHQGLRTKGGGWVGRNDESAFGFYKYFLVGFVCVGGWKERKGKERKGKERWHVINSSSSSSTL